MLLINFEIISIIEGIVIFFIWVFPDNRIKKLKPKDFENRNVGHFLAAHKNNVRTNNPDASGLAKHSHHCDFQNPLISPSESGYKKNLIGSASYKKR